MNFSSRRRFGALAAQAVVMAAPTLSLAGSAFTSGSVTWSWDADTASTNGGKTTFTLAPVSSSALPTSPTFQLNKSGSFGGGTGTGKGSVGYVANATTASWTFAGGTGAAQNDPSDALTGQTLSKVQFGGLYDVTSPGFGPTATGYFSLTMAGTAGVNGSTEIDFNIQWRLGGPSGTLLRSQISDGTTFLGGGSGMSFSKTWTYCSAFSPTTISSSDSIWVGGFLTIAASNGGTPSDLRPIQFEASAAPPTATFFGPDGTVVDWFNQTTWVAPNLPAAGVFAFTEPGALVPTIPNAPGERARFINNSNEPRGIELTAPATIGALHIDDDDTINLQGGSIELIMDSTSGNATIFAGATSGRGVHNIGATVQLVDDLDIRVETDAPGSGFGSVLNFDETVQANTPKNINISGGGIVNFNTANSHDGQTNISEGGTLRATVDGALGAGNASVTHGRLEILTANPFSDINNTINVGPGGVLILSGGTIGTNNAVVAPGGGFSASPSQLAALTVNGPTGIALAEDAFVGHQNIDPSPAANPIGLGNTPIYIYAISTDEFTLGDVPIAVGSGTVSPWIGFGSDGVDRTYGTNPTDPGGPALTIVQTGFLAAIGGDLTINGRLVGAPGSIAQITGSGVVSLESLTNQFDGEINIGSGASLRVNGALPNVASVIVSAGAMLGGDGAIGGNVIVADGGRLDPGLNKYNNALASLTVNSMQLGPEAILEFEFGEFNSDQVNVLGTLVLDGELVLGQLQDFDNQGLYTLFTYNGAIVDNGLFISSLSQPIDGVPANVAASILIIPNPSGGGVVVLAVPEPTFGAALVAAASLLRRRRR